MLLGVKTEEPRLGAHGGAPGEASDRLAARLLSVEEAATLEAHGSKEAGVLVPITDLADRSKIMFTERRRDLSRHPGEISFPGGRPHGGEELLACALRESQEEIALDPQQVEVVGAYHLSPPWSPATRSARSSA